MTETFRFVNKTHVFNSNIKKNYISPNHKNNDTPNIFNMTSNISLKISN